MFCMKLCTELRLMKMLIKSELNSFIRKRVKNSTKSKSVGQAKWQEQSVIIQKNSL
jgi:hypothetical protein